MRKGIVLLTFTTLAGTAAAQDVNLEKLRRATWMPMTRAVCGIGFNSTRGCFLVDDRTDLPQQIVTLRKQIRGDASDAERYYRLCKFCARVGDKKAAEEASRAAAKLYRRQLKAAPDDNHLLTRLALCLDSEEGQEKLLRRIVRRAPGEYTAWVALGDILQGRALGALGLDIEEMKKLAMAGLLGKPSETRQVKVRVEKSLELLEEARACLDKALAVDPPEAEVWFRAGTARFWGEAIRFYLRGKDANSLADLFTPEHLFSFRRAAELGPEDYNLVGWAAFYEAFSCLLRDRPKAPAEVKCFLDGLPEKTRRSVQADLAQLEKLAKGSDKIGAAVCSEMLGMFHLFLTNNPGRSAAWLGRAVKLDPKRDRAWTWLLGVLEWQKRYEDALTASREYTSFKDTAHAHYLAAKAHEALKQWERAEAEVTIALSRDPDSLEALLGLAALLLRRSGQGAALKEAGQVLDRAEKLLAKDDSDTYRLDYAVSLGICLGLKGDHAAARRLLERVLEKDKENRSALEALDALGKTAPDRPGVTIGNPRPLTP